MKKIYKLDLHNNSNVIYAYKTHKYIFHRHVNYYDPSIETIEFKPCYKWIINDEIIRPALIGEPNNGTKYESATIATEKEVKEYLISINSMNEVELNDYIYNVHTQDKSNVFVKK